MSETSPMDTVIEAMARALYEKHSPRHHAGWDYIRDRPEYAEHWYDMAQAALRAGLEAAGCDGLTDYDTVIVRLKSAAYPEDDNARG